MVILFSVFDVLLYIEESRKMQNLSGNSSRSYHVLAALILIIYTFHFNLQWVGVSVYYMYTSVLIDSKLCEQIQIISTLQENFGDYK